MVRWPDRSLAAGNAHDCRNILVTILINMDIYLIGCNGRYTHSTLSLFYLRQILCARMPAARTTIAQYTINDPYFETLTRITEAAADCYCFSVYIWNSHFIGRLLDDIHLLLPDIPLIIGGPEAATLAQKHSLANLTLVSGEIEGAPEQFFADLQQDTLKPHYQCQKNPAFSSPYQAADFGALLANRHIYYESSRGCPFSCSYCLSASDTGVRHLEVDQVKRELDLIVSQQPRIIRFIDRTFNALPDRSIELWRHLIALQSDTAFHFEIAADIFTEEMFSVLAQVPPGKFQFEIGLQSTHPPTLAAVNRKMQIKQALANIARLAALDTIHLHVDLILGLPYETEESYQQTFNDLFACAPHYIQMGLLKVLPDTPLAARKDDFGLVASSHPPYEILENSWLSHQRLTHYYWFGECVEKFYNSHFFKPLFRYLRRRQENGFLFFNALLAACRRRHFFQQAATFELMSMILTDMADKRRDRQDFLEVLQLCWLAAGRCKMPDHLPLQDLRSNKDLMFRRLPQNLPPYYSHVDRNHFFKRCEFASFGPTVVNLLFPSEPTSSRLLCFRQTGTPGPIQPGDILLVTADGTSLQPPPLTKTRN